MPLRTLLSVPTVLTVCHPPRWPRPLTAAPHHDPSGLYDPKIEFTGTTAQGFTECNDPSLTEAVEVRLAAALEAGDNLDARVVLLTLHASVIQPSVVERYGLAAG
jgi:hypothetical protein